jgi:hypothetical protein
MDLTRLTGPDQDLLQRIAIMSVLRASLLRWTSPLHAVFESARGISVLDLVITALVLTVVLLAASYQFNSHEQPATEPQAQTATTESSAKAEQ